MTTKISKFLSKISPKQRIIVKDVIRDIINDEWEHHDYLQIQGEKDIYRIRKVKIRIVFFSQGDKKVILTVDRRGNSYR